MGRIALAFLAGHCCVHAAARLPDTSFVVVLLIALALAIFVRSKLLVVFALGIAWAWGHAAARLAGDLPETLEGEDVLIQGFVASLPDSTDREIRFVFDVTHAEGFKMPKRVQLAWYEPSDIQPRVGERWQLLVRLRRRNGFSNPGGFDYEAYLYRGGIGATGYVRVDERNRRLVAAGSKYSIAQARAWIAERMSLAMLDDARMLGVLQGLAIGDTRRMTSDQWQVFAATGTTHLMAISGLHISMIAAIAAWLGGGIVRWPSAQSRGWSAARGQSIAGSLAAIGYALMAGLSVPTQRTAIMLCIVFAARWWRRDLRTGHALGLALLAILLVDPFAPLAVGAWLSFGAVAIIVLALAGRLQPLGAASSFARVQLAMTIGLLPLLLVSFGSISLVSPLANAVAIPLFTLIVVPVVLFGAVCAALSPTIAAFPLGFAADLLHALWIALEWLAARPLALWHFPSVGAIGIAAICLGSVLLVLPSIWPMRVLGLACCAHAFFVRPPTPAAGEFELGVLDVGQGLAAVVRTHDHVLIYDTGPAFQSGRDAARLAVLPYLRAKGIRTVDMIVVSHGDLDHSGGLNTLIAGMPVRSSIVGSSVDPRPEQADLCSAGHSWAWDGVRFEVLHPRSSFIGDDNDSSCVVRVQGSAGSVLLTGDIELAGEAMLLQTGLAPSDVVVIPHHGSRTSSSQDFVDALSPKVAIVAAGYRNRWGLPKADVIERWRQAGARTYSTSKSGAIELSLRADRVIQVREHRRASRRYWSRTALESL